MAGQARRLSDARVKLLTSQGPGTAIDFGLKIIDLLVGREKAHEVASQLVMRPQGFIITTSSVGCGKRRI